MNKCLLVAIIAVLSLTIDAAPKSAVKVRYDGAQLWSVNVANEHTKELIADLEANLDLSIWSSKGEDVSVFLTKSSLDKVQNVFKSKQISYNVIVKDMQTVIDEEKLASDKNAHKSKSGAPITWDAYYRLDDIYSYLDYLVAEYPDLCSLETIGESHEKRPLKVLKISNGKSGNKAIWIDGGIHAREWISPASVTYIVNDLVENWANQPDYIQNVNFYVLPVHNPDGYEYTHEVDRMWRKNRLPNATQPRCAGVDLNRNFGFEWGGKGASHNPCGETYAGANGFSEPESSAVKGFFDKTTEKFYAFLTYHSYGQYILYPWGYDTVLPPDSDELDRAGKEAAEGIKKLDGKVYSVGSSGILLYPAAGGSDDWGKSIGIKYSYTCELRDQGQHGFVLPPQYIIATGKEAREFAFTIARAIAKI